MGQSREIRAKGQMDKEKLKEKRLRTGKIVLAGVESLIKEGQVC